MPFINLIQEQRLAAKKRDSQTRMMVVSTIGVGALAFLAAGFFTYEAHRVQGEVRRLEDQKERLAPVIAQLEKNEDEIKVLEPRLVTLQGAQENTKRWSRIMDYLTVNTPEGIWLTNITCTNNDKSKPIQVNVQGQSQTQESVGAFILRLEAGEDLKNVRLKFTQERNDAKGKALQFEVNCDLVGSGDDQTKKAKEVKDSA